MSSERVCAETVQAAADYAEYLLEEEAEDEEYLHAYRRYLVLRAAYERQNRYHTAVRV